MQFLELLVGDQELFDVDCTDLLDDAETIISCAAPAIDAGSAVTFGAPIVNASVIEYPLLGRIAQIGKAVQVMINAVAATIPAGSTSACYNVRFALVTSINPAKSAVVCLKLITPGASCEC